MIPVIIILLLTISAYFMGNIIRKKATYFYIAVFILGVVAFIFRESSIFYFVNQGFLGFGFFYLVMFAGALSNKSKLRKKLVGVRKEFSILGFLSITPHAIGKLALILSGDIAFAWFGIATFVLMIPLFITSFTYIRKRMTYKSWKKLQSIAYLVYSLVLIHLIINYTQRSALILYIVLFAVYFIFKFIYEFKKYKSKLNKKKTLREE